MWNITSDDVENKKNRIKHRRAEIEAKYAEEKQALDAEWATIETLERAASEFALKRNRDESEALSKAASSTAAGVSDSGEEKTHSRWRLHLGNRPSDSESATGSPPPAPR
jgi:hypothetical protein